MEVQLKSACEMFEELGYELIKRNVLTYRKDDGGYMQQIMFCEPGHRIIFREWETYENNEPQGQFTIYTDVLQAINKQVEELGWND